MKPKLGKTSKLPAKPSASLRPTPGKELRRLAEGQLRKKTAAREKIRPKEIGPLLHELEVHQIELEMQNDQLRRVQDDLEESRAKYFDLYDLAPIGYLALNELGLILEANLTAAKLLCVDKDQLVRKSLTRFIVREDQDIYYMHRKRLYETRARQVCELRMSRKGSVPIWVSLEDILLEGSGSATKSRVTLSDVSDRKRAEMATLESTALYRAVIQSAQDAIVTADSKGHIVNWNQGAEKIFGYTEGEITGQPLTILMPPSYQPRHLAGMKRVQSRRETHIIGKTIQVEGLRKDRSEFPLELSLAQWETDKGSFFTAIIRDITERRHVEVDLGQAKLALEAANEELQIALAREQHLARTDVLTSVNNRRYWFELAEHEFEAATRYSHPLSVILFDIDRFKLVNDTFGHAAGDQMLERVAQIARAALRSADVIGRYGGEEFVILLPMTTVRQAFPVAERIREGVAAIRVNSAQGQAAVTLSIGIAEMLPAPCPPGETSIERVIRRADGAMYAAKQAGRNRTSIDPAPPPEGCEER